MEAAADNIAIKPRVKVEVSESREELEKKQDNMKNT